MAEENVHVVFDESRTDDRITTQVLAGELDKNNIQCTYYERDGRAGGLEIRDRSTMIASAVWVVIVCSHIASPSDDTVFIFEENLALMTAIGTKLMNVIYVLAVDASPVIAKGFSFVNHSDGYSFIPNIIQILKEQPQRISRDNFYDISFMMAVLKSSWFPNTASLNILLSKYLHEDCYIEWKVRMKHRTVIYTTSFKEGCCQTTRHKESDSGSNKSGGQEELETANNTIDLRHSEKVTFEAKTASKSRLRKVAIVLIRVFYVLTVLVVILAVCFIIALATGSLQSVDHFFAIKIIWMLAYFLVSLSMTLMIYGMMVTELKIASCYVNVLMLFEIVLLILQYEVRLNDFFSTLVSFYWYICTPPLLMLWVLIDTVRGQKVSYWTFYWKFWCLGEVFSVWLKCNLDLLYRELPLSTAYQVMLSVFSSQIICFMLILHIIKRFALKHWSCRIPHVADQICCIVFVLLWTLPTYFIRCKDECSPILNIYSNQTHSNETLIS